MKISVSRGVNRPQKTTIAALMYQLMLRRINFAMSAEQACVFDVSSWEEFLHLMWAVYTKMSRSADGSMMSTPIRVVLQEYNAFTDVYVDGEGIRYTALTRMA